MNSQSMTCFQATLSDDFTPMQHLHVLTPWCRLRSNRKNLVAELTLHHDL
jgi:hypothetical protein